MFLDITRPVFCRQKSSGRVYRVVDLIYPISNSREASLRARAYSEELGRIRYLFFHFEDVELFNKEG